MYQSSTHGFCVSQQPLLGLLEDCSSNIVYSDAIFSNYRTRGRPYSRFNLRYLKRNKTEKKEDITTRFFRYGSLFFYILIKILLKISLPGEIKPIKMKCMRSHLDYVTYLVTSFNWSSFVQVSRRSQ